ncbi:hypothetical protein SELMODRAFT_406814 [Selaginella moellendorffii]|uniref:Uncharacterized protein n=1 Tax=Selaginella moellendorffii TaxID=88036 RepID=D8R309_SELML|nr:hypothetical protein SELMODRAFT_406814 [Selaginella moellendorffii]
MAPDLSFQRKRKLDVVPDTSKRKRGSSYSVVSAKQAAREGFEERGAQREERLLSCQFSRSLLGARSRWSSGETSAKLTDDLLLNNGGCDTVSLAEKIKLSEVEDSHAQERRSTRLRSLIKGEEAVADCPRSLTQRFIIDSSRLEVEVGPEASDWKEQSELLLELEKYQALGFFLAELYLDAAPSPERGKLLDHATTTYARLSSGRRLGPGKKRSIKQHAGWIFWGRFHCVTACSEVPLLASSATYV